MIKKFDFTLTEISGLYKIQPFCAYDERGYFLKDYSKEIFKENGIEYDLMEVFYTSSIKGVVRALHFQRIMQQPKLVRCVFGKVFDVVVDLRKDSPTYSKWISFELSESNQYELLIPSGCAHGYLVLEKSIVSYKCGEKFISEYDDGIFWNDPEIGIKWPLESVDNKVTLSDKDKRLMSFSQFKEIIGGF